MKLVLFQDRDGGEIQPGLLMLRGVVDIAGAIRGPAGRTPADTMNSIVDGFAAMREDLARLEEEGAAIPPDGVRLRPPLPRPARRHGPSR